MSGLTGCINKIIPCSFVDGPGSRFVLFLQGCNMRCATCHNPQTRGICAHCGGCHQLCPNQALNFDPAGKDGAIAWHEARCEGCGRCTDFCTQSADPRCCVMGVVEVLSRIRRAAPFVTGITASGGEPTLQPAFLIALFNAVKSDPSLARLTTYIDTNGALSAHLWGELLATTDGVMVDLKSFDAARHLAMTGLALDLVLAGIERIKESGKLYEVRVLFVPGFNDDPRELGAMANYLCALDAGLRVRLIAFHPRGDLSHAPFHTLPSSSALLRARDLFMERGLTAVVI